MKVRDIVTQYDLNQAKFEAYLKEIGADYEIGWTGMVLHDNIADYVQKFKQYLIEEETALAAKKKKDAEEAEKREKENAIKEQALSNMLITSGFNFDGYRIKKYSGYISGDDAISIDRGTSGLFSNATNVSASLTSSLVKIRRRAITELKEAAYNLGCNAVIGVDFDYITLDPETASSTGGTMYLPYVFCVTANGNAVIIEKIED